MTIQAIITNHQDEKTTYIFENHENRLQELVMFYHNLYGKGKIKDYQVLPTA